MELIKINLWNREEETMEHYTFYSYEAFGKWYADNYDLYNVEEIVQYEQEDGTDGLLQL